MSKLLLTIAAAFLFTSTMAQAEVKTFNFTFSGAEYSNNAVASGFITFDTSNYIGSGTSYHLPEQAIRNFGLTVNGANSANGFYDMSSFRRIDLRSPGPLDFSREAIGQTLPYSIFGQGAYGQLDEGFMLIANNPFTTPTTMDGYNIYANYFQDSSIKMKLTSFVPDSVAAVPEADTSAMLLMGAGVMGFMARRRKNTQA